MSVSSAVADEGPTMSMTLPEPIEEIMDSTEDEVSADRCDDQEQHENQDALDSGHVPPTNRDDQ
jgi:hypothetical protein